jgi:hypothetical protein
MKKLSFLLLLTGPAAACPVCRPKVAAGIHNAQYSQHLLLVLLPAVLLLALGLGLYYWDKLAARVAPTHATLA